MSGSRELLREERWLTRARFIEKTHSEPLSLEANYLKVEAPRQWFALVYAALGDEVNTVSEWLERSAEAHE